jgi:hypothetical protein
VLGFSGRVEGCVNNQKWRAELSPAVQACERRHLPAAYTANRCNRGQSLVKDLTLNRRNFIKTIGATDVGLYAANGLLRAQHCCRVRAKHTARRGHGGDEAKRSDTASDGHKRCRIGR